MLSNQVNVVLLVHIRRKHAVKGDSAAHRVEHRKIANPGSVVDPDVDAVLEPLEISTILEKQRHLGVFQLPLNNLPRKVVVDEEQMSLATQSVCAPHAFSRPRELWDPKNLGDSDNKMNLPTQLFKNYHPDMALKGVENVQYWCYVQRIQEWSDLMEAYPRIWKGVLKCTDAYEELMERTQLPPCEDPLCYRGVKINGFTIINQQHFQRVSHRHDHFSNVALEQLAYNQALDAIGDTEMRRCSVII